VGNPIKNRPVVIGLHRLQYVGMVTDNDGGARINGGTPQAELILEWLTPAGYAPVIGDQPVIHTVFQVAHRRGRSRQVARIDRG
jgi:hypothetical protein